MDHSIEHKTCPACGADIPPNSLHAMCLRCSLAELLREDRDPAAHSLSLHDIPKPGTNVSYIGDYELLEVIAQGGMGVVYRARQVTLNRVVALKLLIGGAHASAEFKRRFNQEARMAAKLHHPNIVPIYEVGEHEGQPYFAMEYVAGFNLETLTRGQSLGPRKAAEYVKAIAEAVAFAHSQGVLHRDLKPSNILIGADDRVRVTDFGLARGLDDESSLTISGEMLGTPGYMPPEQASVMRGAVGVQSDVYSLGAILYFLLTGRPPFTAGSLVEALHQVLEKEPVSPRQLNPMISEDLETLCLKCLEKAAARRYATALELQSELECLLADRPIRARPPDNLYKLRKFVARNRLAVTAATAVFACLLLGLCVSTALFVRERQARRAALAAEAEQMKQRLVAEQEAAKAKKENEKSTTVADFLQDVFHSVGDDAAIGRDTTLIRDLLERAIKRIHHDLGNQPEVEVELQFSFAMAYSGLNLQTEAEALLKDNLDIVHNKLRDDSYWTARVQAAMADIQHRMGHDAYAVELGQMAVAFYNNHPEADQFDRSTAMINLAGSLASVGRFDTAEEVARAAYQIRANTLGENAAATAESFELLAWVVSQSPNKHEEAVKLYEQAILNYQRIFGETHARTVNCVEALGGIYETDGRLPEAESAYRQAYDLESKNLGRRHPADAPFLTRIGIVLHAEHKDESAESFFLQAAHLQKEFPELHDVSVLISLEHLAGICLDRHELDSAAEHLRNAFQLAPAFPEDSQDLDRKLARLINLLFPMHDAGKINDYLDRFLQSTNNIVQTNACFCRSRGCVEAQLSQWQSAKSSIESAVRFAPDDPWASYYLSVLQLQTSDYDGLSNQCHSMLIRFTNSPSDNWMASMAIIYAVAPQNSTDRESASRLTFNALPAGTNRLLASWGFFAKGLAEYRMGLFSDAIHDLNQVTGPKNKNVYREADTYFVLAMALSASRQSNEAIEAFEKGNALFITQLRPPPGKPPGPNWADFILTRTLMNEARIAKTSIQ